MVYGAGLARGVGSYIRHDIAEEVEWPPPCDLAIFGTQIFGSQTPPPLFRSNVSLTPADPITSAPVI